MTRQGDGPTMGEPLEYAGAWGNGISRRDWFAGQALSALAARHSSISPDWAAHAAYAFADAMLAERDKEPRT